MISPVLNKVGQVGQPRDTHTQKLEQTACMCAAYEQALQAAGMVNWRFYRATVNHFLHWCTERHQNWQSLSGGIVNIWLHSLANVAEAPGAQSIHNRLCAVRHWGRWLVATNQLDASVVATWEQTLSTRPHHRVPIHPTAQAHQEAMLADYTIAARAAGLVAYKYHVTTIKQLLTFAHDAGSPWPHIDAPLVERWVATLLEPSAHIKRVSVNGKINILRHWGKWLVTARRVAISPAEDLHKLKLGAAINRSILSIADMGTLLDNFRLLTAHDVMMKAMIELLYGSALRISEVASLKLADVRWTDRVITITDHKNRHVRRQPTTEAALTALLDYQNTVRDQLINDHEQIEGWFFPQRGETSTRTALNHKLKTECHRLGLTPISTHSFRHAAATHMLNKGAGIRQLQELLGHQKITSTQVYTRVSKDQLKSVLQQFHPLEVAP